MATPSSSKTTPSPFVTPKQIAIDLSPSRPSSATSLDDRSNGVETFLARVELSKLTRALRARLSYASYKATNNLSHVPITTLENRVNSSSSSSSSSRGSIKRTGPPSASGSSAGSLTRSPKSRLSHSQMMPPPSRTTSLYSALLGPGPGLSAVHSNNDNNNLLHPNKRAKLHQVPGQRTGRSYNHRPRTPISTESDDINAAAALTSLLHQAHSPSPSSSSQQTLVASQGSQSYPERATTPKPPPVEDATAAELMLFLATSPSPARTSRRSIPSSSVPGRILFPNPEPSYSDLGRLTPLGPLLPVSPPPQSPTHSTSTPKSTFNFGDFINVSPSPNPIRSAIKPSGPPTEGRRLFEDDEVTTTPGRRTPRRARFEDGIGGGGGVRGKVGALEAGIDLVA